MPRVMKDHPMGWVAQECRATDHRGQNATRTFDAQVRFNTRLLGHPAHQRLGLMRVQPITHDMEAASPRDGSQPPLAHVPENRPPCVSGRRQEPAVSP